MDAWKSNKYRPETTNDGPWKKTVERSEMLGETGRVCGRFGERECLFDKGTGFFLFGREIHGANLMREETWSETPAPKAHKAILKKKRETEGEDAEVDFKVKTSENSQRVKKCREKKKQKSTDDDSAKLLM